MGLIPKFAVNSLYPGVKLQVAANAPDEYANIIAAAILNNERNRRGVVETLIWFMAACVRMKACHTNDDALLRI